MRDNKITQAQVDAEMKGDGDGYGGGIRTRNPRKINSRSRRTTTFLFDGEKNEKDNDRRTHGKNCGASKMAARQHDREMP